MGPHGRLGMNVALMILTLCFASQVSLYSNERMLLDYPKLRLPNVWTLINCYICKMSLIVCLVTECRWFSINNDHHIFKMSACFIILSVLFSDFAWSLNVYYPLSSAHSSAFHVSIFFRMHLYYCTNHITVHYPWFMSDKIILKVLNFNLTMHEV